MLRKNKFASFKTQLYVPLSVILKLYTAFLLLIFLAGAAAAQGTGSSVFIYNNALPKTQAKVVADFLADQIGKGLLKQYPCVDWLDDASLRALVGWERMAQILGAEPNDEMLQNLAGAHGARYIVIVSATTLPNGQTSVSVKVLDSRTGRVIANRTETGADPEAALDNAASVAKSIMQDLSDVFKNQCEPHWKGTITYTRQKQISKTETRVGSSARPDVKPNTMTTTKSENLLETVEILLQPMTLGFSGDTTYTRVVQKYKYYAETIRDESGTMACREPGRNSFMKEVSGDEKVISDYSGQNTVTHSVNVSVAPNTGKYRVSTKNIEKIITTEKYERSGNIMGCKPIPFSSIREGEGVAGVGYIELEGEVDPENPDFLSGKKVEGDLENGLETWTWSLHFVKPKPKK